MVKRFLKVIKTKSDDIDHIPEPPSPSPSELRADIYAKYPICHLNSRHKKWVEDLSELGTYTKSETIFESGEYCSHAVYLLRGSVSLTADDGKEKIIHHTDESALYPLARVNPRQYTATALEPDTIMLWVHRKLIKSCINIQLRDKKPSSNSDSYTVEILPDMQAIEN